MSSSPTPQKSSSGTFGERLRREREMRGIKLEEISESTKIGKRNLVALEEERFDQLPGGIFNKGFVRAYAKFLGLDEEQAVNDFLAASANYEQPAALAPPPRSGSGRDADAGSPAAAHAAAVRAALTAGSSSRPAYARAASRAGIDRVGDETSVVKPPAMPSDATVRRRQRLWALSAALVLVVGLAFWFRPAILGLEKFRSQRGSSAVSQPAPVEQKAATGEVRVAQASSPVSNSSANAESPKPTDSPSGSNGTTPSVAVVSSNAAPKIDQEQTGKGSDAAGKLAAKTASASRAARDAQDSITLSLHATSEVWVSAMSDGVSVLNFTLQPGQTRQLRASNHLILKTGNAAALDVSFNGKPLAPLGKENQVRTLTFTPSGLQ